jgi:hypothetical protein
MNFAHGVKLRNCICPESRKFLVTMKHKELALCLQPWLGTLQAIWERSRHDGITESFPQLHKFHVGLFKVSWAVIGYADQISCSLSGELG